MHPRDLVIRGSGVEWLVEAKVVYRGNATHAVRAALAQALEYRFFLHGEPRPRPLALFDQPVGDAYIEFLEAHGVALVWQHDGGWAASPSARRFAS